MFKPLQAFDQYKDQSMRRHGRNDSAVADDGEL
jgi:hypothetical protein